MRSQIQRSATAGGRHLTLALPALRWNAAAYKGQASAFRWLLRSGAGSRIHESDKWRSGGIQRRGPGRIPFHLESNDARHRTSNDHDLHPSRTRAPRALWGCPRSIARKALACPGMQPPWLKVNISLSPREPRNSFCSTDVRYDPAPVGLASLTAWIQSKRAGPQADSRKAQPGQQKSLSKEGFSAVAPDTFQDIRSELL